jgi:carbon monoxide dehydrogenase subunit G
LEFRGSEFIHAEQERVFDFLTDPQHFSKGIPDIQEIKVLSPERFKVVANLGVSAIRAKFDIVFEISEKRPPFHVRLRGHGLGGGSAVDLDLTVNLKGSDGDTDLDWTAVATVSGMLASMGQRVLAAVANRLVREVFGSVHEALESLDSGRPTTG